MLLIIRPSTLFFCGGTTAVLVVPPTWQAPSVGLHPSKSLVCVVLVSSRVGHPGPWPMHPRELQWLPKKQDAWPYHHLLYVKLRTALNCLNLPFVFHWQIARYHQHLRILREEDDWLRPLLGNPVSVGTASTRSCKPCSLTALLAAWLGWLACGEEFCCWIKIKIKRYDFQNPPMHRPAQVSMWTCSAICESLRLKPY